MFAMIVVFQSENWFQKLKNLNQICTIFKRNQKNLRQFHFYQHYQMCEKLFERLQVFKKSKPQKFNPRKRDSKF